MTKNKMTEKEIFALVGANAEVFGDKADLIAEWVEKHIGQLDRKYSSKSGKPTAKQIENRAIKNEILDSMAILNRPVRVLDLIALEKFKDFTSQKLSALINQMVKDLEIIKYVDKRVTYFTLADNGEGAE